MQSAGLAPDGVSTARAAAPSGASYRPGSKPGGPSPASPERTVRPRQAAAGHGGSIQPFERVFEIAQAPVGLGAIEARIDYLLVLDLARYAVIPLPIVGRLGWEVGDGAWPQDRPSAGRLPD
jgi:hypothetical protein